MKNYLPEGFETLQTQKSYINLPKLAEGEYKFRILQQPIAGWIDWKDKKPYRYRPSQKPKSAFDELKPVKAFWSCYVWDYLQDDVFIMEITQTSILKALTNFASDEDWGDFTQYDIKIKKTGSGKETEYLVNPVPHKPISDKMKARSQAKPVNLKALYDGQDPWNTPIEDDKALFEQKPVLIGTPLDILKEHLEVDGIPTDSLENNLIILSEKKKVPVDDIIESALLADSLPRFKAWYRKELAKQPEVIEAVG